MRIIRYIKSKQGRQCNIEKYKCPVCGNTDIHSIGILTTKDTKYLAERKKYEKV